MFQPNVKLKSCSLIGWYPNPMSISQSVPFFLTCLVKIVCMCVNHPATSEHWRAYTYKTYSYKSRFDWFSEETRFVGVTYANICLWLGLVRWGDDTAIEVQCVIVSPNNSCLHPQCSVLWNLCWKTENTHTRVAPTTHSSALQHPNAIFYLDGNWTNDNGTSQRQRPAVVPSCPGGSAVWTRVKNFGKEVAQTSFGLGTALEKAMATSLKLRTPLQNEGCNICPPVTKVAGTMGQILGHEEFFVYNNLFFQ